MMSEGRLLSPDQAAIYLSLGSRWAVYRLISAGDLRAVRLLGKIRLDRVDLDALIERNKGLTPRNAQVPPLHLSPSTAVPARLRRLGPVARRAAPRSVTVPVTSRGGDA